jgi:hypothetical protein
VIAPDAAVAGAGVRPYRPISARLDQLYIRRPRLYLPVIVTAYLVAATIFAFYTPAWQNPDEPAHYNNIAQIATGTGLPVLHLGDYDQAYLDALLATRFAGELSSIAPLRYEAYQPPLYYVTATPVYWLSHGNLLAMRLFNVVLGAVAIVLLYLCVELVFPTKPLMSVGAAAFAAFLPMHLAMNAAVNNDGLAELLLLAAMLALLRWLRKLFYATSSGQDPIPLVAIGVLLGLGMATKIYAYMALALFALLVCLAVWLQPRVETAHLGAPPPTWRSFGRGLVAVLWMLLPVAILVVPLWLRNVQIYGAWDLLGLRFHDAVVVGQPTTSAWIAQYGWVSYSERAFTFTFRSFWGVFGWLGVFMDNRIYTVLQIFTATIGFGLLWALVRFISGRPETDMDLFQFWVLGFLVLMLMAVAASFVWYNLKFVQHQGRYLLWGCLPISVFVALGWRELMQPLQGKVTGFLLGVLAVALAVAAYTIGTDDKQSIAAMGLLALLLLLQPFLLIGSVDAIIIGEPLRIQQWLGRPALRPWLGALRVAAWAAPFVLLFLLDLAIPFWYIVPQLGQ